jgi:hypothetical protein
MLGSWFFSHHCLSAADHWTLWIVDTGKDLTQYTGNYIGPFSDNLSAISTVVEGHSFTGAEFFCT